MVWDWREPDFSEASKERSHMPPPAGTFGDDFPFPYVGYGFVPLEHLPTTYQSSHTVHLWCRTAGRRRRSWRWRWRWRCNCRCWCCRRWHHALLRWNKATPTLQQRMLHLILLKCQGLWETKSWNFGGHYFIQSDIQVTNTSNIFLRVLLGTQTEWCFTNEPLSLPCVAPVRTKRHIHAIFWPCKNDLLHHGLNNCTPYIFVQNIHKYIYIIYIYVIYTQSRSIHL